MKVLLVFLFLLPGDSTKTHSNVDRLFANGRTYWYNNRDSALYYFKEALVLSRTIAYHKGEADAYKGLGLLSRSSTEQLQYYIKALDIREQIKDSLGIGVSLNDIGYIYEKLGDSATAIQYFNESYQIRKKIKDNGGIALSLIQLGHIEQFNRRYGEALLKYREALMYRKIAGESNGIAFAFVNMADVFYNMEQYDSALSYAIQAEEYFNLAGNTNNLNWALFIRASVYAISGKNEQAINILRALELRTGKLSLSNLKLFSEILKKENKFKEALIYSEKWIAANERAREENDLVALRDLAADYEFKKSETDRLKAEERQMLLRNRRDNLQFLVIAIVLTASFIMIILLRKKASTRTLEISLFLAFMLFFEFLILLLDPFLQSLSGATPIYLLAGNCLIALMISPVHHLADKQFKKLIHQRS